MNKIKPEEYDGIYLHDSSGHGIGSILIAILHFNSVIYLTKEEYKSMHSFKKMLESNNIEIKKFNKNLNILEFGKLLDKGAYDFTNLFGKVLLKSSHKSINKTHDEIIINFTKNRTDIDIHTEKKFVTRGNAEAQSMDFNLIKDILPKDSKLILASHFDKNVNSEVNLMKYYAETLTKCEILDQDNKLNLFGVLKKDLDDLNQIYDRCKGIISISSTIIWSILAFMPHKPMVILYLEKDDEWEDFATMTAHLPNVIALKFKKEIKEEEADKLKSKIAIAMKELGLS